MNSAEIVEKLREYSEFVEKFAKKGLLEAEELEVLRKFGIVV